MFLKQIASPESYYFTYKVKWFCSHYAIAVSHVQCAIKIHELNLTVDYSRVFWLSLYKYA